MSLRTLPRHQVADPFPLRDSQTLTVNPSGGLTNTGGTLEATNGGILALSSSTIDNAGGTIKVDGATSAVNFANGVTIQSGTLASTNGGSLNVNGSATLDGSTQGAISLASGSTLTSGVGTQTNLIGTINDNGNLQINAGSGQNTDLNLTGNTTLQGTGTVTLNSGDNNGQAIVQQSVGGVTLTNKLAIQGYGVIGNGGLTVVNTTGGTLDANVSGKTLTVNPSGGLTNTGGTLEATHGGILALSSSTINNAGGTIQVEGGYGLHTPGNFANLGSVTIDANSSVTAGTLGGAAYHQHAGTTLVNSGGSLNAGAITASGGILQVDGAANALTTLVTGTLAGTGTITSNVENGGHVILGDMTTTPNTLSVIGNVVQDSDGVLEEGIGSLKNGILDVTGNLTLAGSVDIDLLNNFVPTADEVFTLVDYSGSESGTLAVTGADAGNWTVLYDPGEVLLEFAPPVTGGGGTGVPDSGGTILLVAAGLAGVALISLRRRAA